MYTYMLLKRKKRYAKLLTCNVLIYYLYSTLLFPLSSFKTNKKKNNRINGKQYLTVKLLNFTLYS